MFYILYHDKNYTYKQTYSTIVAIKSTNINENLKALITKKSNIPILSYATSMNEYKTIINGLIYNHDHPINDNHTYYNMNDKQNKMIYEQEYQQITYYKLGNGLSKTHIYTM